MSLISPISADGIWTNLHLAPHARAINDTGLRNAALVVKDGALVWVGSEAELPLVWQKPEPPSPLLPRHNGGGALVTPGLIDCHTHLIYGGNRAHEFALRQGGASYQEIAKAGGGIQSTVRATRAASEDELFGLAQPRLQALLAEGVCLIEIKSGYGLDLDTERKQLKVARRLGEACGVAVRTSFLGAHALPTEYQDKRSAYLDLVCHEMMPQLASESLIDAVDVFCETIGFSLAETARVFEAAKELGLPVKLHAEQLSAMGGASLAAHFGALSCDHLEHITAIDIQAMKQAGTVAVLLPAAYYALRETNLPPINALREAGVPMALASDHNPGTSPILSLLLAMNMGSILFRLAVSEAILGVTHYAAKALGASNEFGALHIGKPANFVMWPIDDIAELVYWIGAKPKATIVRQGRLIRPEE